MRTNHRQIRRLLHTIVLAGVVMYAAQAQPSGGPPPALVRVDAARIQSVERLREVTGEITPVRRASVASIEPGLVRELLVEVGDEVERGDVIARLHDIRRQLDLQRLEADVRSREADVAEREAQVEKAHRDLGRLEALRERSGATASEVDDARTELTETQARLAQAEAELASSQAEAGTAEARLRDMTILAPFAGSVVMKEAEIGEWVSSGDTVIELVGLDEMDAILDVPERFIAELRKSDAVVRLRLDALDRTIEAPVFAITAQGDRLARTFPVRVRLDNASRELQPGMSVMALVPTGEPMEALTVHKDAIMRSEVGVFVWFDAGGRAQAAPLEALFAVGVRVVVRSAVLKAGMNTIIEGNERLFSGQPLQIDGTLDEAKGDEVAARGGD